MNTALVSVNTHPENGHSRSVAVPVAVPDLDEVRAFAAQLHHVGQPYHDRVWGWEVSYEPELDEPGAEVEVPDGQGGFTRQVMNLWTPASFAIGESGVWFFSLMWENGSARLPVEFLDDRNILKS